VRAIGAVPVRHTTNMRTIWLSAAVAVIGVAAAGALLIGGKSHASPPSSRLASYAAAGEVPPYYVEIAANGNTDDVPSNAMVRATATGKLLATIKPLHGYTVLGATAAADDRTFVLDEAKWIGYDNPSKPQAWQPRSYLLLRLNTAGLPVSLTRLPVTTVGLVTGVALSADGTRLAVADRPKPYSEYNPEQVRIYTLATGAVRIWAAQGTLIGGGQTQTGGSSFVPDDTASLSWTANGKWLAFDWSPFPGDISAVGTWLLNTTLGGASLLGDSRHVQQAGLESASGCVDSAAARLTCEGDVIVTPDGSALICGATPDNDLFGPHVTDEYLKFSTATGKAHVLGSWGLTNVQVQAFGVRWSNSSGSVLIASLPGSGNGRLGIIRGNTFTPLNVPDDAVPWLDGVWLPGGLSVDLAHGEAAPETGRATRVFPCATTDFSHLNVPQKVHIRTQKLRTV
jgi:hypothetical protein